MAEDDQTQRDTERAKARQSQSRATPRNAATQRDTERANERTSGGSSGGGSSGGESNAPSMDEREAAAGLNLAGNDPMSGRRGGIDIPSMDEREDSAGLNLAGNDTMSGRHHPFVAPPYEMPAFDGANGPEIQQGLESEPSSGKGNPGLLIYRADGTQEFVPQEDILDSYNDDDNWSLSFGVTNTKLDAFSATAPSGTSSMPSGEERFDGNADPVVDQTYYRIPVIRTIDSIKYSFNITGIYQEDIFCSGSKGPIVHLIKIG